MTISRDQGKKLIEFQRRIGNKFSETNWRELGMATGCFDVVEKHPRLLRALRFSDEDYGGHVLAVLRTIVAKHEGNEEIIEEFLDNLDLPDDGVGVTDTKIVCRPTVFNLPESKDRKDQVAVMMPFAADFKETYKAIKAACKAEKFECCRVDEIWKDSVVIQDVFSLIYESWVVVVDFTGKNPNVMYETGIAHTLGRTVVPITQSIDDVPFDLRHHRVLKYLPNTEGLDKLTENLAERLKTVGHPEKKAPWATR